MAPASAPLVSSPPLPEPWSPSKSKATSNASWPQWSPQWPPHHLHWPASATLEPPRSRWPTVTTALSPLHSSASVPRLTRLSSLSPEQQKQASHATDDIHVMLETHPKPTKSLRSRKLLESTRTPGQDALCSSPNRSPTRSRVQ